MNQCYTPKHETMKHSYNKHVGSWAGAWTWREKLSRRDKGDDWKIQFVGTSNEAAIAKEFEVLSSKWKAETSGLSNMLHITRNDNYLDIIGMGDKVVPLILKDLMKSPHHWFIALKAITKENPIANAHIGNVRKMSDDWLQWGKKKRLI